MRELSHFLVVSREFFEGLSSYKIAATYVDQLQSLLPPEWSIERDRVFLLARSSTTEMPPQGFKIHVSATPSNAEEVIAAVVPECVKEGSAFKVAADPFLLRLNCSKGATRGSSGKFFTIYPRDLDTFRRLLESLHGKTNHLAGPYILSDRRYRDSKLLFYRYGGFARNTLLTVDGQQEGAIAAPDGTLEPDRRTPFFRLPDWIDDPFGDSKLLGQGGPHILRGRYEIQQALQFSNAGGVYKAVDLETNSTVVVKEARPLTACWRQGDSFIDAVQVLQREYAVLRRLEHLDFIVKPLDLFTEWEHMFLVEEFVDGIPLNQYRATLEFALAPFTGDALRAENFCRKFRTLALELCDAITAVHSANILIGDLSPNNVIVNPETLEFKLIDFESAHDMQHCGEADLLSGTWATPGFRSPERARRPRLTKEDDYYALGMLLYSLVLPVQSLFELEPNAKETLIDEIGRAAGVPEQIKDVIFSLLQGHQEQARSTLVNWSASESLAQTLDEKCIPREEEAIEPELRATTREIAQYLMNTYDVGRQDRLWPSDYSVFMTNPLSIAYGACGTILGLKDLQGEIPGEIEKWLFARSVGVTSVPPGLYVGLAGVAWTLAELGRMSKACDVMRLAYSSSLLYSDPTLFHGAAGWGLASLRLYQATGDRPFLTQARNAAGYLISAAEDRGGTWCWKHQLDDTVHLGIAFGASGIALFLLNLYVATADESFLTWAHRAMAFEIANAMTVDDHLVWGRSAGSVVREPYWLHGAAGIASVLIRFHKVLGDQNYLSLAQKAATGAFSRFSVQPTQFEGLSGIGEVMLDMYMATGDIHYRKLAFDLARSILCYRIPRPEGCAFPGRLLLRIGNDFGYGTAGVGCFLNRLLNPAPRRFHDLESGQPL
jgi:serine/threonine protein kinase